MENDLRTPNERLKYLRESINLSQKEFAKRIGITQSYLSAVEGGKKEVTVKIALSLIELFEVSLDWVFAGKERNYIPNRDEYIPKDDQKQSDTDRYNEMLNKKEEPVPLDRYDDPTLWKDTAIDLANANRGKYDFENFNLFNKKLQKELSNRYLGLSEFYQTIVDFNIYVFTLRQIELEYIVTIFDEEHLLQGETYDQYRDRVVAVLQEMAKYQPLMSSLSAEIKQFIVSFKPFDTKGVIDDFLAQID